jgi:hypothetical protein
MKLSKMHFTLKLGCLSMLSAIILASCTTAPTSSAFERQRYLESFIGKSSETIQSQLNLSQLGYQNISAGKLSPDRLTYRVARPISIPIPMADNPALGLGSGSAVPIPSSANSYDVDLSCIIEFSLKNSIATDVRLTGRTC